MWHESSSASNSSTLASCRESSLFVKLNLSNSLLVLVLTLPLALAVLVLGYRRWRPRRSFDRTSHSDVLTLNVALALLQADVGRVLLLGDFSSDATRAGSYLYGTHFLVEILLHGLTCVDRYLAIVWPVPYLRLRRGRGVAVRDACVGGTWALALGHMGLQHLYYPSHPQKEFMAFLALTFGVVSFCGVSVLRVLTRPAPGHSRRPDGMKRRAFQTVAAIMAIVLVWVLGDLVTMVMEMYWLSPALLCLAFEMILWVNVPCGLVLPVLYLHRAGQLPFCSGRQRGAGRRR